MKRIWLIAAVSMLVTSWTGAQTTYYVSASTGDDTFPGTAIDSAFKTIAHAVGLANPGDTIFVRAGTYATDSATIRISRSGTSTAMCNLLAYPGERPLLDFSRTVANSSARGISLSGSYWHIYGLDITRAGDNAMVLTGSHDIVENCSFSESFDTGLQLGSGASFNRIINCDSYYNADPSLGNADGFAPKLDEGTGNYFYGCRSWQNSDDGWDGYLRPSNDVTDTLDHCWSFSAGFLKNGAVGSGNGNGFKLGGSDAANLAHNFIVKNCLAFDNKSKGFDQNHSRGSLTILNCTAYNNGIANASSGSQYNFSIPETLAAGKVLTVKNCMSLGSPRGVALLNPVLATNSWPDSSLYPTTVTSASIGDFITIDTAGLRAPRQPDGSLPDITFMHLVQGSQFIDAGTPVGLPYMGSAPDLGAFESDYPLSVAPATPTAPSTFALEQNYPNPFNPSTQIAFSVDRTARTTLEVFNLLGQQVATLYNDVATPGRVYRVAFNAGNLPSGVYFYRLRSDQRSDTRKLVVLK